MYAYDKTDGSIRESNEPRRDDAPQKQAAAPRQSGVLRIVLTVLVVFIVILISVTALAMNGAQIPFLSTVTDNIANAFDRIANQRSSSDANSRGWIGGAPSELMGSGGAWDGTEIRLPTLSLSYDASEETEFRLCGKYLVECSRSSFYMLDKDGKEVFHKYVDFTKPNICNCGDFILASDLGGRSAFLLKNTKMVWEGTFNGSLYNASVNKNGYIALIIEMMGYRNSVKVIAPIGKTLFDWVVADDYVISSEVAPSGNDFLINRLKTSGVSLCSSIEILNMNPEPYAKIDSVEGEVYLSARYLDNNKVAIVTDKVLALYSDQAEPIMRKEFESIMAMCEFPRGSATVAIQQNNRALVMQYDAESPDGRVLYIAGLPVVNLSSDNGCLFINLGHEVIAINEKGVIISHLTLDSEVLYGSASETYGVLAVTRKSADVYF